jgi:DNA polymerase III sliding clamp (beta) subunit (PCNA family)
MKTITISGATLYRALGAANYSRGTDQGRPFLTTFYVDSEKVHEQGVSMLRIVTTDSYRMSIVDLAYEIEGEFEPFMFTGDVKTMLAFLKARIKTDITVSLNEFGILMEGTDGARWVGDMYQGTFPDYRQLIAAEFDPSNQSVAYNPVYLADIGNAVKALAGGGKGAGSQHSVRFDHNGPHKPARFRATVDGTTLDQWLMPVRVS